MPEASAIQQRFAQRWRHLQDRHVRSLAWLLDSPDLLDPAAPDWQGRIATLGPQAAEEAAGWLAALDAHPAALHAWLDLGPFARLGRYAEKLMSFYYRQRGILVAQGLQVRTAQGATIGEFDFLLDQGDGLVHIEFAVKFYLMEASGAGQSTDYFVGPNLVDTLGAKMGKIFSRQLELSHHPAAAAVLPAPVARAQALVKGWLFYHGQQALERERLGITAGHCRGFWCALGEFDLPDAAAVQPLNRLDWLAPARLLPGQASTAGALRARLAAQFRDDSMPVLVALLEEREGVLLETARGFIVPDDWQQRAGARSRPPLF